MAKGLTDVTIRNLKPGPKRYEKPDPGARGLYVIVQPSGVKSFAVRYRFSGKPRKLTLKSGITLASARKEAGDALYEVEQGRDPSAAKRRRKEQEALAAANTFETFAGEYLKRECGMKRDEDGRAEFKGDKLRSGPWRLAVLERLVYPTLGGKPIAEIKRSEIVRLLNKIECGELKDEDGEPIKGGPVMADRTLAVIRKILNWHATRADDFASPIVRGMARVKAEERARERTLTDDEIRAVWKAADATEGPFGAFLQFLLLTAARRTEAAQMKRGELSAADWEQPVDWTLPAARNKAKVDLIRPLSASARAALARLPKPAGCEFVFSTDGASPISGFSHFKEKFDEVCGVEGWGLHDLRRTARSLMSRAGVDSDHAERCLGHLIPGARRVYDRHQFHAEKQRAYEALATQIQLILQPPNSNVLSMPARG